MDLAYLLIAQAGIDLFLLFALIYIILVVGRKETGEGGEQIKGLLNLLDKRINDANSASARLSAETEGGANSLRELSKGLEARKIELQHYLERIDSVLKAIDEVVPAVPPAVEEKRDANEGRDRYREAARLAEQGVSIDEIARRVGIPKGEIQLVIGLKRHQ